MRAWSVAPRIDSVCWTTELMQWTVPMLDLTVVPRSTATPLHACYFLITVLKMGKPKPQTLAEDFTKKIMRAPKETLRLVIGIMSPGYAQSCPGCRAPLTGSTPLPTPRPLSPKMVCMGRSPPPPPTPDPRSTAAPSSALYPGPADWHQGGPAAAAAPLAGHLQQL